MNHLIPIGQLTHPTTNNKQQPIGDNKTYKVVNIECLTIILTY